MVHSRGWLCACTRSNAVRRTFRVPATWTRYMTSGRRRECSTRPAKWKIPAMGACGSSTSRRLSTSSTDAVAKWTPGQTLISGSALRAIATTLALSSSVRQRTARRKDRPLARDEETHGGVPGRRTDQLANQPLAEEARGSRDRVGRHRCSSCGGRLADPQTVQRTASLEQLYTRCPSLHVCRQARLRP